MIETQDAQPQIEEKPVTAEAPVVEAEKPAEPEAPEVEDDEKLPSWAKKKLRNMERSMRHAQRKLGAYEERLQTAPRVEHNQPEQDDSEPLSLSRRELEQLVQAEAKKLAPVLKDQ